MKPPKEGSSKRKVWDVFTDKGADAAMKMQGKVPVGDSTVRSWIAEWSRAAGGAPPAAPKKGGKTSQVKREKLPAPAPKGFDPWYKYTSRTNADLGIVGICKRNGMDLRAYHVLEQDGKFAIVPRHHKPADGTIPQFKKGETVYIMGMSNSKATVQEPGPEATIIKYLGPPMKGLSRPDTECVSNVYILKFEEPAKPSKTKGKTPTRERL